ncbi:MAG: efflux transporter outer membrane subunit [Aquimonas sp.]|jgi:multidrug efflux system outer membrane protein|nr:efflux transporter outer membrane subunit [Aquimonas sp.]
MTKSSLAFFISLAVSGCATLEPRLPEADASIPAHWPLPTTTSQSSPGTVADIGWRDFFTDDKLDALIALALENNRDLRIALLNVERSRGQYRIRRADRVPSVGVGASLARTGSDEAVNSYYEVALGITNFELDLFGRVRSLSASALQQFLSTQAAQRSAQLALIAEVANNYLALSADQELQRLALAALESHEATYRLAEQRRELGAVSALDVAQARTVVERARADAARYAGRVAQDTNALALLIGAPVPPELLPDAFEPRVSGLGELPAGMPSEALLRRPDVVQAEHRLRAANANIGAARAAFFPSISLTGSVGTASDALSGLFESGSRIWTFLPQITIPIFEGGRLRAGLEVATAERDIELAQYEKAIQAAFRDVADALALSRTLSAQRQALESLVDAAARSAELSQARYRAGRDSYLTLLDAQRTLDAARQSLIEAQFAEQANRVTLYRALGGGWATFGSNTR